MAKEPVLELLEITCMYWLVVEVSLLNDFVTPGDPGRALKLSATKWLVWQGFFWSRGGTVVVTVRMSLRNTGKAFWDWIGLERIEEQETQHRVHPTFQATT